VEQIRVAANPQLSIEGVLRTMFDPRNNLSNEVSAQLVTHFGDKVFRTIIRAISPRGGALLGKPALFHDRESRVRSRILRSRGDDRREEEAYAAKAREALAQDSAFAAAAAMGCERVIHSHAIGEDTQLDCATNRSLPVPYRLDSVARFALLCEHLLQNLFRACTSRITRRSGRHDRRAGEDPPPADSVRQ